MVFEAIVVDILNKYVGDYVENLDPKQLRIGIWGGDIVLENLILKQSALQNLNLPIQTSYGHLGKLILKIPWKSLYSSPVIVVVEKLYLLVLPNHDITYNKEKEEKTMLENKRAELLRIEEARKKDSGEQQAVNDSFIEKLTTQIIKNVQITIKDIHIRYEDKITNPSRPFSFGVTLSNLSVQTTGTNWEPTDVNTDTSSLIFKMLTLEALAIYWNSDIQLYSQMSQLDLSQQFLKDIATKDFIPHYFRYALGPINSSARLRLNPKPENDEEPFTIPKVLLNFEIEKLAIGMTKTQYQDIMLFTESIDRMSRALQFRKYRPNVPLKGNSKTWWKFAYTCTLEDILRRRRNWEWEHILAHRNLCREYANLYRTQLQTKKLPSNIKRQIEECEKQIDLFNLVIIRQQVQLEVERIAKETEERNKQKSWWTGWFGGSSSDDKDSADSKDIMKEFKDAMTPEEKGKLYKAIGYQENSIPTEYPEIYIATSSTFILRSLEINIKDDTDANDENVLYTNLMGVNFRFQQRPGAEAVNVAVKIDKFTVYGVTQGDIVPQFVSSQTSGEEIALLDIMFETNPLDKKCGQRLFVKLEPLKIIYDAQTVIKLCDVFKTPPEQVQHLNSLAESKLIGFKEMSATGMEYAITQHTKIDLNVHFSAPYIIMPYGGLYKGNEDIVLVNLGTVKITSLKTEKPKLNVHELHFKGISPEEILQIFRTESYDNFLLEFNDMQILFAKKDENWQQCLTEHIITSMHLLQPMNLMVNIDKCLVCDDPRLPAIKIVGELPSVILNFSDKLLLHLLALALSIPLPQNNEEPQPLPLQKSASVVSMMLERQLLTPKPKMIKKNLENAENFIQFTKLEAQFAMKEFMLILSESTSKSAEAGNLDKLLSFNMLNLELDIVQQTYNMSVDLKLGGVGLQQYYATQVLNVISTPMTTGNTEYLLSIRYITVDKTSPELHSKYSSCEQSIIFDFTSLNILLHQEGLLSLLKILKNLQNELNLLMPAKENVDRIGYTNKHNALDVIPEDATTSQRSKTFSFATTASVVQTTQAISPRTKSFKSKKVETIVLKLKANLNEVGIEISCLKYKIVDLKVKGVKTDIIMKSTYTQIEATLQDIIILDCNKQTKYPQILHCVDKYAISTQIVLYNVEESMIIKSSDVHMSISLKLGRLRVVVLNYFINRILNFLNKFQDAQDKLVLAAADAAEVAKQNMQSLRENAIKLKLNIDVDAPDIILPKNSTSFEVVMLSLGNLKISNNFLNVDVEKEYKQPIVIDNITLVLNELKLSCAKINSNFEIEYSSIVLNPITFTLWIKRNLSSPWYKKIPDVDIIAEIDAIELYLTRFDYLSMLQVITENLAEEASKIVTSQPTAKKSVASIDTHATKPDDTASRKAPTTPTTHAETHISLKFSFAMKSFIVNLFTSKQFSETTLVGIAAHSPTVKNGLARFSMNIFSFKGKMYSDDSLITTLLLVDCLVDDIRPERQNTITRMLERKAPTNASENDMSEDAIKSMIDVTYQQKQNSTFISVRVFSFNFIISMEYFMKLVEFFSLPDVNDAPMIDKRSAIRSRKNVSTSSKTSIIKDDKKKVDASPKTMTFNFHIEKPDIILIDNLNDIDNQAMILHMEMTVHIKMTQDFQTYRIIVNNLELYIGCYNPQKRQEAVSNVLEPFNFNVTGCTPVDGEGLHFEVILTAIKLKVTPLTINIMNRIMLAMKISTDNKTDENKIKENYSEEWTPKVFDENEHWFLRIEEGEEADEEAIEKQPGDSSMGVKNLNELCLIGAPSIIITLETGKGKQTKPMLLLQSNFNAQITQWSTNMNITSCLTLQMHYYNDELALWEPMIEPIEINDDDNKSVFLPWELKFEMQMNNDELIDNIDTVDLPSPEEEEFKIIPKISIEVSSKDNLEVTITKTSMQVMTHIGEVFQAAVAEGISPIIEDFSPYKIINETGLQITLQLNESGFEFYTLQHDKQNINEIIVESGAEVPLTLKNIIGLNTSKIIISSSHQLDEQKDKELVIYISELNKKLTLPIVRTDKRYYSLNYRKDSKDVWGIVSEVRVEGAQMIVTLRSMLQIYNHFNLPVHVYYMTNLGNELEFVKKIPPGELVNLPLQAIYTLTNELFFSVEGYHVTTVPYIWKDLQLNLSMVKILQCPSSREGRDEPFIMKVRGEIEQIYNENTLKHTIASTCYNLHLQPPIIFKNYLPIPVSTIVQGDLTDYIIQPGDLLTMPTANPGLTYIVFRLQKYLEKNWHCKYNVLNDMPEFQVLQFESNDSSVVIIMDLGLHSINKNGSLVVSIYCPFWMLNKTGLMLSYRKSRKSDKSDFGSPSKNFDDHLNVMHHPEDFKGPILFSFSAKNFFGKKKASIRVDNGEWSDKFSIDVAGSSGMVVCRSHDRIYQIGVRNQLTYNNLTKQIIFTPYMVIINNAEFDIECQELDRPADAWIKVTANSCTPLWPSCEKDDKLLKVRIVEFPDQIAAPFFITEVHNTILKLPNKYGGICVDVQITEGAVYITFTAYKPGLAPALIINHTGKVITFWEKQSITIRKLDPLHSVMYTWENPTGPRMLMWETGKKNEIEDDLRKDGIGDILIDNEKLYWVSFLNGMQRVVFFTTDPNIAQDAQSSGDLENIDQDIIVSIHGLGLSIVNNVLNQEIMYVGIASSGVIWETCKMNGRRFKPVSIKECNAIENSYQQFIIPENVSQNVVLVDPKTEVDFRNNLMLKPNKRKMRRIFNPGVWLQIKTSATQLQIHAKINRVQVDNQIYNCIYPVVLAPVLPMKSVAADMVLKPFAELSIVQRISKHSTVQQYKYFKVLIQEFHIKVDLNFVNTIMTVLSTKERTSEKDRQLFLLDMSLVNEPLLFHVSEQSLQEQKNFYDLLHFSPLKIHISFSLQRSGGGVFESTFPEVLNVLLQGIGVTLTDMHDVIFRLAFFERNYTFLTQKQLTSEATAHYVDQAIKQLYVLVLGLDVIGNPYGLVLGLSKGVEDLFYEPFQGAIQGPSEFVEGLALGVRSLFGHTVGGAAGAVSRITGAMGKGVAVLTFDKDYQRRRREQLNKQPANLQEGLARSAKGLATGVVDGVTGVFTKPITGAKEQGVGGFFKGLGKGAIGLVTRPTGGVIDFASGSLDAVKRAAELSHEVRRLRAPRFMYPDKILRPYSKKEAEGNKLLFEIEKGKYATTDIYSYHDWIISGKDILLLTDKRLAYVNRNDIFGSWEVEWTYTWQEINEPIKVDDRGVSITIMEHKKKVLGLFSSDNNGKIIIIPDPDKREFIKEKMETLRLRSR